MSKVPNIVWVCILLAFMTIAIGFVYLASKNANTEDFRYFLDSVLRFASLFMSAGAFAYAGKASHQTNGGLDERIKAGAKAALIEHLGDKR